jgi:DNA-binding NarL/FixJ family response regulator
MKISIFIIEDDPGFGKLLLSVLSTTPLLEVAGIAQCLADARSQIDKFENDVYLVDISLPDGSGIDIMHYIKERYTGAKILALSTLGDEKHIFNSIQAGAAGYLLKSEMSTNVIQSIVSLVNDGGYLSSHASKVLIQRLLNTSKPAQSNLPIKHVQNSIYQQDKPAVVLLTKKEFEVLSNAQSGTPAKRIADTMGISIFTVNQHLRSIYQKLNVRNKMEAVQSARQKGLL